MSAKNRKRPFGVTILAVLAGVLAAIAGIHTLQSLGILPFAIGPFSVRAFSFFNALMWGLLVWVYIWLIQMLWNMDRQAWLFLAVITVFNLILDFMLMLGGEAWSDVSLSFLINGLILIYIMLPSVRNAFEEA
jgi:drug/metabolite transporter (DMT)-like permease